MNGLAESLFREAQAELGIVDDDCQVAARALQIAEERRSEYALAQGDIVGYVLERDLHTKAGYTSIRQYLKAVGLSATRVSNLCAISTVILPFCRQKEIKAIDEALTAQNYARFREAIPTLRGAVEAANVEKVERVLDFVLRADSRDTVRKKLRPKTKKLGYGMIVNGGDEVVIIAKVQGDPDVVARRLNGLLELNSDQHDRNEFARMLVGALGTLVGRRKDEE